MLSRERSARRFEMVEHEPMIADEAPGGEALTAYDEARLRTYLRLLDADAEGADWREVARIVLNRDPDADHDGSLRCWETHLARARLVAADRHGAMHEALDASGRIRKELP
nr:DUF2285 domain-containing protein [Sphingomonas sp. IC081]